MRVCAAKGISLAAAHVKWVFSLPKLSDPRDMAELQQIIIGNRLELVFFDPTYLCLLDGNTDVQAASMFEMGPLLARVSELCLDAGATPNLIHHYRKPPTFRNDKQKGRQADPPELEDLAFAGFGEYARQWLLLGRREPFDPDTGHHALWLSVGGSAGHAGLYGLDVTEGRMDERFGGRRWEPHVRSASELIEARQEERDRRPAVRAQRTRTDRRHRLLAVLRGFPNGLCLSGLAKSAGVDNAVAQVLLGELITEGHVEQCEIVHAAGRGQRSSPGYRLAYHVVDDEEDEGGEHGNGAG